LRVQLWVCDTELARRANPEARLRTGADTVAHWIVCMEFPAMPLRTTEERLVEGIVAAGAGNELVISPRYRLSWRLGAEEAPAPAPDPA
jgi:hypothetical protein